MKAKISIVLGSKNDIEKLKAGFDLLKSQKISYSLDVISAHRHPDKLTKYCKSLESNGAQVVIACAGMAAALPGFVASYVNIPVIGVGLKGGMMDGMDALFSMVSAPKGIGLVSTGLGSHAFINAIIVSLEILAISDKKYKTKLLAVKKKFK